MTEITTRNRAVAAAFLDLVFNQKRPAEAFERYVAADYVQHNPLAPDGRAASMEFLAGFLREYPELRIEIRRTIAEEDMVVTHSMMWLGPDDRGSAVADIVRLHDGLLVEHWDVVQHIPDTPANANGML